MINWKLLRKQKKTLVSVIEVFAEKGLEKETNHLLGILHLLDSIQDSVVDHGGATSREVFGKGF